LARIAPGCHDFSVLRLLFSECGWSVETAVDRHYSGGGASASSSSGRPASGGRRAAAAGAGSSGGAADVEFKRFEDKAEPGKINMDGIEAFAKELGVDPFEDFVFLSILQQMGCKEQGVIRQEEFITGLGKMGVSSVSALKAKVPTLRDNIEKNKGDAFSSLWTFAYDFSCEPGQKSVSHDIAVGLTQMLLDSKRWPLADAFKAWLASYNKTLSKDTWKQLGLRYITTVTSFDFKGHSDDDNWPSALDDFKDWTIKTLNTKGVGAFTMHGGGAAGAGAGGK
jgi:Cullin binding